MRGRRHQDERTDSRLAPDTDDGRWHGTSDLPAGSDEWTIAINDSSPENDGASGAGGGTSSFSEHQVTHVPSVEPVS